MHAPGPDSSGTASGAEAHVYDVQNGQGRTVYSSPVQILAKPAHVTLDVMLRAAALGRSERTR